MPALWYPLIEEVSRAMRSLAVFSVLSILVLGCATTTPTQKGALAGSAIGAGLGAIIGHQSGEAAEGALIGAAAGGLGGALIGDAMASKFCPTCGRDYFADTNNCPLDGALLRSKGAPAQTAQQQETEAALSKFCPTCGRSFAEKESYCSEDGAQLKTKQP